MNYKVSFHHKAESEFEEAYNWYAQQQQGLEERFFDAINKKLQQIQIGPELYSIKNSSNREAKASGFPFVIVYKIEKRAQIVRVIAIHHTSRKPKKKYNR